MPRKTILCSVRIGIVTAIFSVGFLCGSMTQHNANAGLADVEDALMKSAAESGGTLGTAAQLGTTITDMEKHISGLQNNLETIKKVKKMLGG